MLTLTVVIPLLVAVLGALVYALAGNAKLVELGKLAFFAGLLVCLFAVSGKAVHLGV